MAKNSFQPATQIAKKLKVLLYGGSGTGKTWAALTFPKVAVVDAEHGTDLYGGRAGVPAFSVIHTKVITELEQAMQDIQSSDSPFETLVVDPITVFYDVLKEATAKTAKNGQMGFPEWNRVNNRMNGLYHALTSLPVHVVIIAREAIEYEGDGMNLRKVGQKPDADKKLPYMFDFVVRMNADQSGTVLKSRGMQLNKNNVMPQVNWDAFAAAAQLFASGTQVERQSDDSAADAEADSLQNKDNATAFFTYWRGQGLTDQHVLAVLQVSRIRDWTAGRAAADARIIEVRTRQPETPE